MKKFLLILIVVATIPYINTLRNRFVYDDLKILKNPLTKTFDIEKMISTDFWYPSKTGSYRPVTVLTYSLNYFMSGKTLNSPVYHSFNLLLNALNAVLVFLLVKEITKNDKASFFTAALFALHPIHVESVATMFGRPDLLCMLFMFLSFLLHVKNYSLKKLDPRMTYLLSILMFFLSILSKGTGIILIGFIVLYDVTFKKKLEFKRYLGYLVVIVLWFSMRTYFQIGSVARGAGFLDNPLIRAPLGIRMLNGIKLMGFYIHKLMFPLQLSVDYSYNQIPVSKTLDFQVVLSTAFLSLLLLILLTFRRRKLVFFSLGFLFLSLIPVSNILMPIGSIFAERFMYIPSFGFVLLLVVAIKSIEKERLVLFLIIALLCFYSVRTFIRVDDFRNSLTLWQSAVESSPMSAKAHSNLGVSYLERMKFDPAIRELKIALRIYPIANAANSLGSAYGMKGDYETAIDVFEKGLKMFPGHEAMEDNLARAKSLNKTFKY